MSNAIRQKEREILESVRENEDTIERLISPEDIIHQDVQSWEEVDKERLVEELHESLSEWHFQESHPYESSIQELAALKFLENASRVSMDILNLESHNEAIRNYVWPNEIGHEEALEIIFEEKDNIEWYHEFESEAQMEIENEVIEARIEDLE